MYSLFPYIFQAILVICKFQSIFFNFFIVVVGWIDWWVFAVNYIQGKIGPISLKNRSVLKLVNIIAFHFIFEIPTKKQISAKLNFFVQGIGIIIKKLKNLIFLKNGAKIL